MNKNKTKFKVAAVQSCPAFLDLDASGKKVIGFINEAAHSGAALIVFPEVFLSGYPDWVWVLPPSRKDLINELYRELLESAVTDSDPAIKIISEAAEKAGVYVALGVNE